MPSVPNRDGETLNAKLTVQSNGNQRFVVPVTLQIGQSLVFGAAAPAPVVEAVAEAPAAPPVFVPPVVSIPSRPSGSYRRRQKGKPAWMHLLPALLLLFALFTAVVIDLLWKKPGDVAAVDDDIKDPVAPTVAAVDPYTYDTRTLKDTEPLLTLRYNKDMRFGLEMSKETDPTTPTSSRS